MHPHPVTVADAILIADTLIVSDGATVRVVQLPASDMPPARIRRALGTPKPFRPGGYPAYSHLQPEDNRMPYDCLILADSINPVGVRVERLVEDLEPWERIAAAVAALSTNPRASEGEYRT